jgi:hypothetical protein
LHRTLILALGNEKGRQREGFDKAKAILGSQHPAGFVWDSAILEDEDHGSVVFPSHYFALRKIFDGWESGPQVVAGGLSVVKEHFKALAAKYKYPVQPPENVVNNLAYDLLRKGKDDEAIATFKFNVEHYPNSANVYDSLAEVY